MSKCSKRNKNSISDTISTIKELSLFIDSKEEMLNIYTDVIENKKTKKKKRTKK